MEGNYNAIDVVKVLMACVVVAIHTHPESDLDNLFVSKIVECLYSITVPFFFVVSGFFLSNKIKGHDYETKISYIQRWLSRIVRLYLIWTLIYLPYAVYGFIRDDLSWEKTLLVYFRNVILVGENFLSWPLWYLLAMIVSGCIFYIMIKFRIKEGYMLGIALCLAVICPFIETLRSTELGDLYFSLFKTTRNGFFVGFPYMMIGYLMIKPRYREYNVCWSFLLLLISFVLMMNDVPMANFVAVYALVVCLLSSPSWTSSRLFSHLQDYLSAGGMFRNFRLASSVIYFVHMLYVGLFLLITPNMEGAYLFASVLICCIFTSILVVNNRSNGYMKLLFE